MAKKESRLICPECSSRVAWNGAQFVCVGCPWTEHMERPPSSSRIPTPSQTRDSKRKV